MDVPVHKKSLSQNILYVQAKAGISPPGKVSPESLFKLLCEVGINQDGAGLSAQSFSFRRLNRRAICLCSGMEMIFIEELPEKIITQPDH
jgi:hypothetical protein